MGIPKFFRWMNDRYQGLLVTARESQLPEIDNFYLDMNGIIHNCTHPCDGDVHFRISEEEMFEDIFNYISTLFKIIKPKEYFFMAVDGVAPRAKMNQQRGRRFRSAKEALDREEAAIKKGDILPTEQRFDSNCITPGTEFMVKLNKALQMFIRKKLANDSEWQKVKVILSGHETPGEGEHKVMDFIRYQRSQPGYNPQTRHCLYGLDTDLIMLGLSSHEPNFMLLREEIKFTGKKGEATKGKSQRVDPSKVNFNVLYLSMLRDYIEKDFLPLKPKLSFKFDLEAIIDDWILICFLVGNDFIPHIPHFHIHKNALPKIFEVYQDTLTKLDGYMNVNGVLNLKRFKIFAKALSVADFENYKMLLKENGGECAKDDFSKLNMFVKHKMRIHGARDNNNSNSSYNGRRYNNNNLNNGNNQRSDNQSHHSQFQQSNVWYNLQRAQNRANGTSNQSSHSRPSNVAPQLGQNNSHNPKSSSTPNGRPYGGNQVGNEKSNTAGGGRVGVHSFTEAQINNSITVCADGDFIDLSDEECYSGEKFPGGRNGNRKPSRQNGNGTQVRNFRSTPKKEHQGKTNAAQKSKPTPSSKNTELDDFRAYKRTYYKEKLKLDPPNQAAILKVVNEYVRALQWNLHYYYHGCVSWGWFYPYHYAPFISDIVNFESVDTRFEMGEPFKPFDQLLSVLPAASSSLLPKFYRHLVTSTDSPLAKFFPTEVEYDLNGKQNDWEAVVLAPFIEEDILLKASVLCNLFLSNDERASNRHGPHLLFYYEKPQSSASTSRGPRQPQPMHASAGKVKCIAIALNGFFLPINKIRFGLINDGKDKLDQPKFHDTVNGDSFNNNTNNNSGRNYSHQAKNHGGNGMSYNNNNNGHRNNHNNHRNSSARQRAVA